MIKLFIYNTLLLVYFSQACQETIIEDLKAKLINNSTHCQPSSFESAQDAMGKVAKFRFMYKKEPFDPHTTTLEQLILFTSRIKQVRTHLAEFQTLGQEIWMCVHLLANDKAQAKSLYQLIDEIYENTITKKALETLFVNLDTSTADRDKYLMLLGSLFTNPKHDVETKGEFSLPNILKGFFDFMSDTNIKPKVILNTFFKMAQRINENYKKQLASIFESILNVQPLKPDGLQFVQHNFIHLLGSDAEREEISRLFMELYSEHIKNPHYNVTIAHLRGINPIKTRSSKVRTGRKKHAVSSEPTRVAEDKRKGEHEILTLTRLPLHEDWLEDEGTFIE